MSFVTKIQKTDGGDTINVASGGAIKAAGTQATAIADAKVTYTTGDFDTDAEIIAAVNTTNGKINDIIAALEGVGILAS